MWLTCCLTMLLLGAADLQGMLDGARPGQTLIIPDGTYAGIMLEDRHFPAPVTVKAQTAGKVIVMDHPSTEQPCWIRRSSGLRFDGILFASKRSHAVHIDGNPMPQPQLSYDIQFNDCTMVSLGEHYCAKLSQSRLLVFDRCYFFVPDRSKVKDHLGGGFDAVAVDDLVVRYCRFDIRRPEACTLMVKGGSRNVVIRDSVFDSPAVPTFFLAGPTDPSFRTRPNVAFELERLRFENNTIYFADSTGENLHGTWDALGNAEFVGNTFHNVGQMLFVGKRTEQDLHGCENVVFRENKIHMRAGGFASPYNAIITSQNFQAAPGAPESPVLRPDQFHAENNSVWMQQSARPEMTPWIARGFEFETTAQSAAKQE